MTPSLSASRRLARGGWSTGRRLDGASDIIISPEKGGERSEMNSARALRISRSVVRSSSEQNIPLAVSRSWALSLSFCSFLAMLHLAQLSCPGRRLPSLGNNSEQKTGPHRKSPALFGPKRQARRGSCGVMLPCLTQHKPLLQPRLINLVRRTVGDTQYAYAAGGLGNAINDD